MLAPLPNYWGGGAGPPGPPLFLRLCNDLRCTCKDSFPRQLSGMAVKDDSVVPNRATSSYCASSFLAYEYSISIRTIRAIILKVFRMIALIVQTPQHAYSEHDMFSSEKSYSGLVILDYRETKIWFKQYFICIIRSMLNSIYTMKYMSGFENKHRAYINHLLN